MSPNSSNEDDGFFNDLSRQPHSGSRGTDSPPEQALGTSKTKRIACVICRKRKLKCDGNKPKCATCERLGHNCAYDEVRRKSGPKRGYVKDLEARLAQVETQLKSKDKKANSSAPTQGHDRAQQNGFQSTEYRAASPAGMDQSMPEGTFDPIPDAEHPISLPPDMMPDAQILPDFNLSLDANFSWEMIGLGLEEPMPMQEAIEELTEIYFSKIHPSLPIIHKYRYAASMDLNPEKRPPICLRYIMWCHAASISDRYIHHQEIFYKRARKYMEIDEMKGQGEGFVTIAHAQAWILIATYEFKMMYFPRAWLSVGRAARLVLMMGLNRVDGVGMDVKQCLPPPRDWTEKEERRRTFWMAYCIDRYASIGTGWPMSIDEKDIMSNLPASEDAYERSIAQNTTTLTEAMTPQQVASLSSFAGVVFVSHYFGLNLTHLHRPEPNQREDDLQGEFWRRHRKLDTMLSHTSLALPSHLRLPGGIRDTNVIFLNFAIHTSTICLHQAAIFKAERNHLSENVIEESRSRCIVAAQDVSRVMRLISNTDLDGANPFMAFCLYVAARVFVQSLKRKPQDQEMYSHLNLLLAAMRTLQRKNHLTESFLVQLNLDMESSGLDIFRNPDYSAVYMDGKTNDQPLPLKNNFDPMNQGCSPIINLSESSPETTTSTEPPLFVHGTWSNKDNQSTARIENIPYLRKESPSTRVESPPQQQFVFRNIDQSAQNGGRSSAYFPENVTQPSNLANIYAPDNWTPSFATNGPIGLNPVINGNMNNMNNFDTEMSDQANHSTSTGLTPGSSGSYNHSSVSNPSFTPPGEDQVTSQSQATSMPTISGAYTSYTSVFTPPADNMYQTGSGLGSANARSPVNGIGNSEQSDPFKMPAGWDLPAATPGGLSGMTPEGGWEKMMESWGREG